MRLLALIAAVVGAQLLPVAEAAFGPSDIGIVVNTRDPLSIAIADYYRTRRGIPAANVARIEIDPEKVALDAATFARVRDAVVAALPPHVQAYALTWAQPYRVACMSITSAFAFGFDAAFCADGCLMTRWNPYYDASLRRPYQQLRMRPAMSIATRDVVRAKALIERGIAARDVGGGAYLVRTSDPHRNVRSAGYESIARSFASQLPVHIENAAAMRGKRDVMFYFTGAARVAGIESNRYAAGAVADHLTSLGGQLTDSSQMSALRWLEAGVTGSYGTVVEPCNFPGKFPNPEILMRHYLAGDTLIEAYWKSVAMVGQGIFIGEPLARPYGAEVQ